MRQCLVQTKKWTPHPCPDKSLTGSMAQGTWTPHQFFAIFHDFAIDSEPVGDHYAIYPCAIVETADGKVLIYPASCIQFVKPTPYESIQE